MNRYAREMTARGPALAADGTPTGSLRIVGPADRAAARAVPPDRDELIAHGPLLSDNGATWLGTAAPVLAPSPDAARAVLAQDRYADIEVHTWQFCGRPS